LVVREYEYKAFTRRSQEMLMKSRVESSNYEDKGSRLLGCFV
jgi:hypothetical protein